MLVYTEQTIENWIIMLTVFCCSSHLLHLAEKWLSPVINACTGEVRFMIPACGVPTLDAPRQPFRDPQALAIFIDTPGATVRPTSKRCVGKNRLSY